VFAKEMRKITWKDVGNYWVNDGPKLVFIIIWLVANGVVFAERFNYYYKVNPYIFSVVGWGIPLAKGSAAALKLNCACILLTVLRNIISFVRGTFCGTYLPVDKNITFHKWIAYTIGFFTILHGLKSD